MSKHRPQPLVLPPSPQATAEDDPNDRGLHRCKFCEWAGPTSASVMNHVRSSHYTIWRRVMSERSRVGLASRLHRRRENWT